MSRTVIAIAVITTASVVSARDVGVIHEIPVENFSVVETGDTGFRLGLQISTEDLLIGDTDGMSLCRSFVYPRRTPSRPYDSPRHKSLGGYLGFATRCGFKIPDVVAAKIESCVIDSISHPDGGASYDDFYHLVYEDDKVLFNVNLRRNKDQRRSMSATYYCRLKEPWS